MLLALLGFPKDEPVTMLTPAVVCRFPFRIDDRPLADLHDAIARGEANRTSRVDQFNVRPLISMVMNVIGDLGEQHPFIP